MKHDSKKNWDSKLIITLWVYRNTYKVTPCATPFSFVYGIKVMLFIEFELPSFRIAIDERLDES